MAIATLPEAAKPARRMPPVAPAGGLRRIGRVTAIMDGYLAVATIAADLLGDAAVARRWEAPSALPGMSVGALAGHLARQVFSVEALLAQGPCGQRPISLLDHYARVPWIDAGLDDEPN